MELRVNKKDGVERNLICNQAGFFCPGYKRKGEGLIAGYTRPNKSIFYAKFIVFIWLSSPVTISHVVN